MPGATRTASVSPVTRARLTDAFENLPGVADAIRVSKPYKLISLDLRPEKTIVRWATRPSVATSWRLLPGLALSKAMRRRSPWPKQCDEAAPGSFRGALSNPDITIRVQGLGEEGLRILAEVREVTA